MAINTIQTGAHQASMNDVTKYSLMLGGLNVTHDALQQYDPLTGGYGRLFMVREPLLLNTLFKGSNKFKNFKHILEYGNTQVQGLGDVSVDFQQMTGGYAGRSFEIPSVAKDETNAFQVTVYEFSGSPIREMLHTWINAVTDLQSGLTHYGGLIATGSLGYSQANQTAEFIYVVTDRTGMKVEYACMFANCFPKGYKNDQFNYQQGEHNIVETTIEFSCVKYESIDINKKANALLKNYQILVNSLEFHSGLNDKEGDTKQLKAFANSSGYSSKTGELETGVLDSTSMYFYTPSGQKATESNFNDNPELATPSYTTAGSNTSNLTGSSTVTG